LGGVILQVPSSPGFLAVSALASLFTSFVEKFVASGSAARRSNIYTFACPVIGFGFLIAYELNTFDE
jgi:hypothetical protein